MLRSKIAIHPKIEVVPEETQSICPQCKTLIPALLVEREGKVIMHKRCAEHGEFEAMVYGDASMFQRIAPFNKPGVPPRQFTTKVEKGCPWVCGICPEHRQHLCMGIIEVTSACNLECPLCLADALGPGQARQGFELTYEQVNFMLDRFVLTEGQPEVVQFSGGEPSLHPRILDFSSRRKAGRGTGPRSTRTWPAPLPEARSRPAPKGPRPGASWRPGSTRPSRPCPPTSGPRSLSSSTRASALPTRPRSWDAPRTPCPGGCTRPASSSGPA